MHNGGAAKDTRPAMTLASILLLLGALFLAGLVADVIGERTRLPRVTFLLLLGVAIGEAGFGLLPEGSQDWFGFLSTVALSMVAFLLGSSFTLRLLRRSGREIVVISLVLVAVTFALVAGGLLLVGAGVTLALVLAALACATDPAASQDAIRQAGGSGGFSEKLRGIVALDDAWGLLVFALAIAVARSLDGTPDLGLLVEALREIGGGLALGAVLGVPGAYLTGRVQPGEPLQSEALALVFLTAGLALWLEVSFLIAAMTVGAVIANVARHHTRAFHEIERIQWPFMLLFFILAGATLDLEGLAKLGPLGAAYVVLRIAGRALGGWLGARAGGAPRAEAPLFGPALLAQAGVAVGMALVAAETFPEIANTILPLTIGATVLFEILGPVGAFWAVRRNRASSLRQNHNI